MNNKKMISKTIGWIFLTMGIGFLVPSLVIYLVTDLGNKENLTVAIVFTILAVTSIVGAIISFAISKSPSKLDKLKKLGVSYPAKVISAKTNPYYTYGYGYGYGINSYINLECVYEDKNGKSYAVTLVNYRPNLVNNDYENLDIRVWVDPSNPKKYAVEVLDITDKIKFDYDMRKKSWY